MRINSTNNFVLGIKTQDQEKKIEEGDVIRGKVVSIDNNRVFIKTSNGQTISASFFNKLDLSLGQSVELFINSVFADQAFAELKDSDNKSAKPLSLNEKIINILKEINIPIKQETQNIAKLLIKYGMPVNKENMQRIIELQSSIRNLSENITPEKIIGLLLIADKANDIPIDILSKEILINENSIKETYTNGNNIKETYTNGNSIKETYTNENSIKEAYTNENKIKETHINEGIQKESLNNGSSIKDKLLSILKEMNMPIDNNMSKLINKSVSIFEGLSTDDIKNILFLVSNDIDVTPKNLIELGNNVKNDIKIGDTLNNLLNKIGAIENNVEELSELKSVIEKLFITPEKFQDNLYVEDKFQDIFELGRKIEEILYKNNIHDIEFNKLLNEVKDKLDFIKVVNENNNYLHMPLLLNNQRSTLDIYIVNDKKNQKQKKPNNDNATVLISLDLNNIGHIESMITIEKKNVSLVFRTDNNMIKDLINSKLMSLNHLLKEKGYVLTASKVTNIDERFSLNTISNIQRQDKLKDFHFDLRV